MRLDNGELSLPSLAQQHRQSRPARDRKAWERKEHINSISGGTPVKQRQVSALLFL